MAVLSLMSDALSRCAAKPSTGTQHQASALSTKQRGLSENATDPDVEPRSRAVEADAGAREYRADDRVGDDRGARVGGDVGIFPGVERRAGVDPAADHHWAAEKIRQSRHLIQIARRDHAEMIA